MKKPLLYKTGLLKISRKLSLLHFSQIFSGTYLLLNHKDLNERFNTVPDAKTLRTVLKFYDAKAHLIPISSQILLG